MLCGMRNWLMMDYGGQNLYVIILPILFGKYWSLYIHIYDIYECLIVTLFKMYLFLWWQPYIGIMIVVVLVMYFGNDCMNFPWAL